MRRVIKILTGFLLLAAVFVGSFFVLENNHFFVLNEIEIIIKNAPENPLYLKPVLKKLNDRLDKYKQHSIWKIDLGKLNSDIAKNQWVADYKVERRFPNSIRIIIQPQEVKLLYLSRGGKLVPVIGDGSLLEPLDAQTAPDLPLLVGDDFYKKPELRKKSVDLVDEIPKQGAFSQQSISEIRYDQKDGFWMTLINQGIQVKIGEEQVGIKSERVSQVLDYMETNNFQARVIDANLSKKVLVRLRKDP